MLDDKTLCFLYQMLIELYKKKADVSRAGATMEEPEIPDEPTTGEFIEGAAVSYLDDVLALPLKEKSLADLIREKAAVPNNQIDITEAIAAATSADVADATAPETTCAPLPAVPAQPSDNITVADKLRAWLVARGVWRVERDRRNYEYDRKKTNAITFCDGLDFAIDTINKLIKSHGNAPAQKEEQQ